MRVTEAKQLLRELTEVYFAAANVTYANQSRVAQPEIPLVLLTFGNVSRPNALTSTIVEDTPVEYAPCKMAVAVDLFTNGAPVEIDGVVMAYDNNAMEEMLAFADFLGSRYALDWCQQRDITILIDGDVTDLTGIINDTSYEFRTRMNLNLYFTQKVIGYAGVLAEASIQYPVAAGGEGEYSTSPPTRTNSVFPKSGPGPLVDEAAEISNKAIIVPVFSPSVNGGGTQELADAEIGCFDKIHLKEENGIE